MFVIPTLRKTTMRLSFCIYLLVYGAMACAQLALNTSGTTYTIDFESTLSGVSNGVFGGSGFQPTPGIGQLDSDAWEVLGCSDGDLTFGNVGTSNDLTRGNSLGGTTAGGIYSFEVASGDHALGFQPSGADLTPGSITLRLENTTGTMITRLQIDYLQFILNDEARSNEIVFSFSYDNTTWIPLDTINSPQVADPSPTWTSTSISENIGVLFTANSYLFLRWKTDDLSGSGARDEFTIDDIAIVPTTSTLWPYINEIMVDPDVDQNGVAFPASDDNAEWFELYNPLSFDIYLTGLLVEDNTTSIALNSLVIAAHDSIVLGQTANQSLNGGYTCDFAYLNTIGLNNTGDQLSLLYPDNSIIDEVDFNSWSIVPTGAAMRFAGLPADDNNLEANWLVSSTRGGSYVSGQPSSDLGTPGFFTPFLLSNAHVSLYAYEEPEGIRIMWKVNNDDDRYTYQLEHSYDGQHFQVLVKTKAGEWLHAKPSTGDHYYRIKVYDETGLKYTSTIIRKAWETIGFHCYPNPSKGDLILLQRGKTKVDLKLEIFDLMGQLVYTATWQSIGGHSTFSRHLALPNGYYRIVLREHSGDVRWSTGWQVTD